MERPDLTDALGRVLGPAEPEIGCDECFELLDRYVELELAGADADAADQRAEALVLLAAGWAAREVRAEARDGGEPPA